MTDQENNTGGPLGVVAQMPCPMCGAMIAIGSRKCAGCGEILTANPTPKKSSLNLLTLLTGLGIGAALIALFLPSARRSREPARRSQCKNNLRQIAIALHNYEEVYHALPPAYTVDAEGRPLHSWRTLILPQLDQEALYKRIDLSKPWDDPANAEARETRLPVYSCPSANLPRNHTTYMASVGSNGCLRLTKPRPMSEITDGRSETLMVVEVPPENSVPWMSPNDADEALVMSIGRESKLAHTGGMEAALCDGSVRFISAGTPAATRRALISIAGGDTVGDF